MIKGLIFDLDGTTIDTLQDITDSVNRTLSEYGFKNRSIEEVRMGIGTGYINLINKMTDNSLEKEKLKEIAERYRNNYSENVNVKTKAFDGVKEILKQLQQNNIKLAVNSNKSDQNTKRLIGTHFPEIDFVAVIGARENYKNKPDPQTCNEIIEMMNLSINEVAFVGDSDTDILTAKNANIKSIGCLWGYRDRKTLEKEKADYIIEKPEELLQIVLSENK